MNIKIEDIGGLEYGSFKVSIWVSDPADKLVITKDAAGIIIEGRAVLTYTEFQMLANALNETLK